MDENTQRAVDLLQKMLTAHESDMSCSDCAERMDCLAELTLAGKTPEGVLEAVQRHVECCRCCRHEYDALIAVLRMSASPTPLEES